jgi:hypothetical protein
MTTDRVTKLDDKLWEAFSEWGEGHGVEADGHEDDWLPWWRCFQAGVAAARRDAGEGEYLRLGVGYHAETGEKLHEELERLEWKDGAWERTGDVRKRIYEGGVCVQTVPIREMKDGVS